MSKKVFFIYRNEDYALDGMRSALGLAVENNYAYGAVIDVALPEMDEYNKENLEWIRDMEGEMYSTVQGNVDKNEMVSITIEELGQKLRDMDFIIPYGAK